MGVADRAGVLAFLKQNEGAESPSLAEQRARIESLADFFPVPEGAEIEPATVGGIAGEWTRGRRARRDAAVLYLHGGGYVIGSPKSHRHLTAALSEASGLSLFVPDYRLAPGHRVPPALEDGVGGSQR